MAANVFLSPLKIGLTQTEQGVIVSKARGIVFTCVLAIVLLTNFDTPKAK